MGISDLVAVAALLISLISLWQSASNTRREHRASYWHERYEVEALFSETRASLRLVLANWRRIISLERERSIAFSIAGQVFNRYNTAVEKLMEVEDEDIKAKIKEISMPLIEGESEWAIDKAEIDKTEQELSELIDATDETLDLMKDIGPESKKSVEWLMALKVKVKNLSMRARERADTLRAVEERQREGLKSIIETAEGVDRRLDEIDEAFRALGKPS